MTPEDPLPSKEQHRWQRIAAALRCKLARQVKHMEQMDPEAAEHLVDALRSALFFERDAALYDFRVEKDKRGWE